MCGIELHLNSNEHAEMKIVIVFLIALGFTSMLKGQHLYDDFIGKPKSYLLKLKGQPYDDLQYPEVESYIYKEASSTVMTFLISKKTKKIQSGFLMIGKLSDIEAQSEKNNYRRALQKKGFTIEGYDKFGAMLMTKAKREAHLGIDNEKDGKISFNVFFN